jgi:hypothetical protein
MVNSSRALRLERSSFRGAETVTVHVTSLDTLSHVDHHHSRNSSTMANGSNSQRSRRSHDEHHKHVSAFQVCD